MRAEPYTARPEQPPNPIGRQSGLLQKEGEGRDGASPFHRHNKARCRRALRGPTERSHPNPNRPAERPPTENPTKPPNPIGRQSGLTKKRVVSSFRRFVVSSIWRFPTTDCRLPIPVFPQPANQLTAFIFPNPARNAQPTNRTFAGSPSFCR